MFLRRRCRRSEALAPPRAPETADSQVKKHHNQHSRRQKSPVVGAVLPACLGPPQNRAEDEHRQQEEHSRNFEPDFSADAAERLEEAAQSACNAAGGLSGYTAAGGGIWLWRSRLCGRAFLDIGRRRIGLLAFAHKYLTGKAACHAHANAQYTADGFRSHFVTTAATTPEGSRLLPGTPDMMVAAVDPRRLSSHPKGEMPVAGRPREK